MADLQPHDRLEQALTDDEIVVGDEDVAALVAIAHVLRDLPDDTYRHALRHDLERTIAMTTSVEPNIARSAGISYLHIPARSSRQSAAFYRAVFDWELRGDADHPSFTDGTGHVTGRWVEDLEPSTDAGMQPFVYVDSVDEALARVVANGGEIVRAPYAEGALTVATFRDPAGNLVGVWQAPAE